MSPLKYFHLLRCSLLHATPVRNMLRHLHAAQGLVCPFAKLSSRLTAQLCCAKFCRCFQSLQRMTFEGKSAGRMELRKHSLFKRLSARIWQCREWAAFVGLKHPVIDLHASFSRGVRQRQYACSNSACIATLFGV